MNTLASLSLLLTLFINLPLGKVSGYRVLTVKDGDTIKVEKNGQVQTVRLACIDAPEKSQTPYGASSLNALSGYLPVGTIVDLRTIAVDKYGRQVSEVFKYGTVVNVEMVITGNAFVYRNFLKNCEANTYDNAEKLARASRLGVWAESPSGITRPWAWRHKQTPQPTITCKQLDNRQKALELYRMGHTYLDRNNDGIPCN